MKTISSHLKRSHFKNGTVKFFFVVWTVHNDLITMRSAVVGSWEEPPNIWLTVAKNAFVGWALNFRVRMLLKGAVTPKGLNYTQIGSLTEPCITILWFCEVL